MSAPTPQNPTLSALPVHTLQALSGALTAERIQAAALAIDAGRDPDAEAALAAWHGFACPGLMVTPYQYQAGLAARDRGIFAFNRQERAFLSAPLAWRHHEVPAALYELSRAPERLVAHALWPFRQDCPVADWEISASPRWWSHGLVHTMVGFGWWPGLTEWELMHMARLGEMIAALHWYWLGELGRAYCPQHTIRSGDSTPDCAQCAALEASAAKADTRAARIGGAEGRLIADNAVQVLAFELASFRHGVYGGQVVVPPAEYLGVGEACEYARVHHRRLTSPAMARYLEHCLRPDVDYATSPAGFEARCADVLNALLTPAPPSPPRAALRGMAVLRDLGGRLCHLAALNAERGAGGDHGRGLRAVADGLGKLAGGVEDDGVEALLAVALAEVAADLRDSAAAAEDPVTASLSEAVFAVGYRPTSTPAAEPAESRAARRAALARRAFAIHASVGLVARELTPAADRVIDQPRRPALLAELFEAAMAAADAGLIEGMPSAYAGFVVVLAQAWEGLDPAQGLGQRWYYRLSSRSLPPEGEESSWRILRNPYLSALPVPFDLGWLEEVLAAASEPAAAPFAPRYTTAAHEVYTGPGRERPVVLAATEARQRLHARALQAPTVKELLADARVTRAALETALAEELLLCLHLENPYARWPRPDDLVYADVDEAAADS
jgi:hypothetical protein